jgi:hypothetical protein
VSRSFQFSTYPSLLFGKVFSPHASTDWLQSAPDHEHTLGVAEVSFMIFSFQTTEPAFDW